MFARWHLAFALVAWLLSSAGCSSYVGPVPERRADPPYPQEAKDRRVEGWALVSFTVTKEGGTKDIVVLDSQPEKVWDETITRTISTWRYQPALKNGKPVETVGVKVKHHFELEH